MILKPLLPALSVCILLVGILFSSFLMAQKPIQGVPPYFPGHISTPLEFNPYYCPSYCDPAWKKYALRIIEIEENYSSPDSLFFFDLVARFGLINKEIAFTKQRISKKEVYEDNFEAFINKFPNSELVDDAWLIPRMENPKYYCCWNEMTREFLEKFPDSNLKDRATLHRYFEGERIQFRHKYIGDTAFLKKLLDRREILVGLDTNVLEELGKKRLETLLKANQLNINRNRNYGKVKFLNKDPLKGDIIIELVLRNDWEEPFEYQIYDGKWPFEVQLGIKLLFEGELIVKSVESPLKINFEQLKKGESRSFIINLSDFRLCFDSEIKKLMLKKTKNWDQGPWAYLISFPGDTYQFMGGFAIH
ncbi:MAG: hypothetical protein R2879_11505 [Saprospiraceae bacterium]